MLKRYEEIFVSNECLLGYSEEYVALARMYVRPLSLCVTKSVECWTAKPNKP